MSRRSDPTLEASRADGSPTARPVAGGNPQSTARIAGHPVHPMLIPFPVAFLVATLACDLAYWATGSAGWVTGSTWLLGAALVMAALAAVAGLIDFFGDERIRALSDAWQHMVGNVIAVVVALVNFYLRRTDGEAAVLPWGLLLSFAVVGILLFTGWKGWEMVYRHRVAVSDEPG